MDPLPKEVLTFTLTAGEELMNARSIQTLCLFIVFIACSSAETRQTDPITLSGDWLMQITPTSEESRSIEGVVSLTPVDPESPCLLSSERCEESAKGRHTVPFERVLGGHRDSVRAALSPPGKISLTFGACCDRGEVFGRGSWNGKAFVGVWEEVTLDDRGRRGEFLLSPVR